MAQYRARIRALTSARNEAIAQAIEDGVRISLVAGAVGESVPRTRLIALSFEDVATSTVSADGHLCALRNLAADLSVAVDGKLRVEHQLEALIPQAFRLGFTDATHVAGLAGLSPECVRQSLRGLRRPRAARS